MILLELPPSSTIATKLSQPNHIIHLLSTWISTLQSLVEVIDGKK